MDADFARLVERAKSEDTKQSTICRPGSEFHGLLWTEHGCRSSSCSHLCDRAIPGCCGYHDRLQAGGSQWRTRSAVRIWSRRRGCLVAMPGAGIVVFIAAPQSKVCYGWALPNAESVPTLKAFIFGDFLSGSVGCMHSFLCMVHNIQGMKLGRGRQASGQGRHGGLPLRVGASSAIVYKDALEKKSERLAVVRKDPVYPCQFQLPMISFRPSMIRDISSSDAFEIFLRMRFVESVLI